MKPLRVTPSHGPEGPRLYVSLASGRTLAWYDRDTGRVSLLAEARRDQVLAALAPYATRPLTVGPPPVPTPADLVRLSLHPDDDLAPNRPGEALHAALEEVPPSRRLLSDARRSLSLPRRFRADLRGFRPDPRRETLDALRRIGDELDTLGPTGWRVLHCVPLPGRMYLDHLLIGPAGVLAVHTLPARRRFHPAAPAAAAPLRRAALDAERASLALATAVRPALAVAGTPHIEGGPAPDDVLLLREGGTGEALVHLGGVLKPADIESLYASARNRRTWLHA
ncbi:nuclease-related domain-containing protein [Streptomyces sp. NPDC058657]|uniref:nuclease-related domain-containing protein n=1 Tax=unclassified Streptomyces TaxID=2593676 RepID=UPI0036555675